MMKTIIIVHGLLAVSVLLIAGTVSRPQATLVRPITKGLLRYADEAIEAAARLSGRHLDDAAQASLRRTVATAARRHGDDVLVAMRNGGLELAEAAARHGDDVWKWSSRVPGAARSLALHADDLVPMTRRLGRSVLRIEAKAPGLPRMLTGRYNDDLVCSFVRTIHPDDATKAAGFLGKADGPATRALLLKRYKETEGKILKWLDWKTVMAFGLTAAVVTSAHEVSDGVQEGLKTVSQTSPETFGRTLTDLVTPVTGPLGWLGLGAVVCLILAIILGLHLPSRMIREVRRVRAGEPKEEISERRTHQDGDPPDPANPPEEPGPVRDSHPDTPTQG
ncbi:MAG: hypothetical protein HN976_37375 [Lentisphaerae bacterium]|nr:hypothetical protein [Lentisphaerota bacterium]